MPDILLLLIYVNIFVQILLTTNAQVQFNPEYSIQQPKQYIDLSNSRYRFPSNHNYYLDESNSSEPNFFKILDVTDGTILLGARNAVYNLSVNTLQNMRSLVWAPEKKVLDDCGKKGKSKEVECHNYIRVFVKQGNGRMLICGTYAYSPKCGEYDERTLEQQRQFDGQALSPYDPRHNSTFLFVSGRGAGVQESDGIYSGTVSDFAGSDSLIYWKPLTGDSDGIRTQRDDVKILDSPNFVGSFEYGKYVYFWFREWAAESNTYDREVYSRVARVCKNDRGGRSPTARNRWTTFLKARLNCSIASATPFYFNELQAVTKPMLISGEDTVYALFTTPESSFQMSAVCSFTMKAIEQVFDYGDFKVRENLQSLWISHKRSTMYRKLPFPRPGSCVTNSTELSDKVISFITRNAIMHSAVPSRTNNPIYVQGPEKAHLTQIAILPELKAVSGILFTAIFLGTADGHLLKLIETDSGMVTVVESIRVFKNRVPIGGLALSGDKIIVVSAEEVAAVPLQNCEKQNSCGKCVGLQDGFCAWNSSSRKCQHILYSNEPYFVQNITFGSSSKCPGRNEDLDYNIGEAQIGDGKLGKELCTKAFTSYWCIIAWSILVAILAFAAGFRCALKCPTHSVLRNSDSSLGGYDGCAGLTASDALVKKDHYSYGKQVNGDLDGVVRSLTRNDRSTMNSSTSTVTTPTARTFAEKNIVTTGGTLTKGYKAKQVYL